MDNTTETTFQRKEVKYLLSAQQLAHVRSMIQDHLSPTEFSNQHITSVYLDTPDRSLISRSLEKPLYKEKLRLRTYDDPVGSECAFIELKKKFMGVVYKRRAPLSLNAGYAFLKGASWDEASCAFPFLDENGAPIEPSDESRQIAAEIEACRVRHGKLVPSIGIRCRREAYTSVGDTMPVRITFDHEVSYCDYFEHDARRNLKSLPKITDPRSELSSTPRSEGSTDTSLTKCTESASTPAMIPLLDPGACIMEIKVSGAMPLWLSTALSACQVFPSSFSKYGEAYRACVHAATPRVAARAKASHVKPTRARMTPRKAPAHARTSTARLTPVPFRRRANDTPAAPQNTAPSPVTTTIKEKAHA